jgi:hypothetical protein
MKRTILLIIISLIALYSSARMPIFCNGKVFVFTSLNKLYSLNVIAECKINPKFAIAVITKKGDKNPVYVFKTEYGSKYDYIISETGETVIQLISFMASSQNSNGVWDSYPYSEIKVFRNGKLQNSFNLDFVFCTFSTKTEYQEQFLDIDESQYLNLHADTLFVVSNALVYKVNIKNGEASLASDKKKLNSYKYKWKKLRCWHIQKYRKYDEMLDAE